jgi:hypothetical protein
MSQRIERFANGVVGGAWLPAPSAASAAAQTADRTAKLESLVEGAWALEKLWM